MTQSWRSNPATDTILSAARDITLVQATALPWMASKLMRHEFSGLERTDSADKFALHALATCQQAICACIQTPPEMLPVQPFAIENTESRAATAAITAGANSIGSAGHDGFQILIENLLPPMRETVKSSAGERRIHELVVWFLLALSVGPNNCGPEEAVHKGILLAYPVPEEQMVWH